MTKHPRISVVTPSYNQARFLDATLRSVLDQDYPNLEYIVVDGGSTDGSVDIIRRYEDRLACWVSESDNGQSDAINKGFRQCTGDIVAWINSDDVYVGNVFEFVSSYFEEHPDVDMVYGDAEIIDGDGKFIMHRREVPFDGTMGRLIGFGFLIPQPAAFWRRSVLESVGFLNEDLHYAMDSDLWARIHDRHTIQHVPKLLAQARYHDDAKTIQVLRDGTDLARTEWKAELRRSYDKLAISRWLSFGYAGPLRRIYRLKRIFARTIRGHYFSGYKAPWQFRA